MSIVLDDREAVQNIAKNVQRFLDERGWSQADLARAVGTNEMRISRLVRALRMPGVGFLARIAEVLDVHLDDLLARPRKNSRKSA